MRRTELLQELRKMRFEEAYGGWESGRLTQAEAAHLLGICERTFRRYLARYEASGLEGLIDRRLEQASHTKRGRMNSGVLREAKLNSPILPGSIYSSAKCEKSFPPQTGQGRSDGVAMILFVIHQKYRRACRLHTARG